MADKHPTMTLAQLEEKAWTDARFAWLGSDERRAMTNRVLSLQNRMRWLSEKQKEAESRFIMKYVEENFFEEGRRGGNKEERTDG